MDEFSIETLNQDPNLDSIFDALKKESQDSDIDYSEDNEIEAEVIEQSNSLNEVPSNKEVFDTDTSEVSEQDAIGLLPWALNDLDTENFHYLRYTTFGSITRDYISIKNKSEIKKIVSSEDYVGSYNYYNNSHFVLGAVSVADHSVEVKDLNLNTLNKDNLKNPENSLVGDFFEKDYAETTQKVIFQKFTVYTTDGEISFIVPPYEVASINDTTDLNLWLEDLMNDVVLYNPDWKPFTDTNTELWDNVEFIRPGVLKLKSTKTGDTSVFKLKEQYYTISYKRIHEAVRYHLDNDLGLGFIQIFFEKF